MHKTSRAMRSVTFAAIFGLALTTGAVGAPVASAQDTTQASSTIDVSKKGSLTLFKRANPEKQTDPTGEEDSTVTGAPLQGVKFKLERVKDVDLKTNEGLAAAAKLTPESVANNLEQVDEELTTDENGKVRWENLELGVYLVTETESPTKDKDDNEIRYSPVKPFLVFIPMTRANAEAGGTEWLYDVVAYPKNSANQVSKTVKDENENVDGTVEFTVSAKVPTPQPDGKISKFVIRDDFETEQVELPENYEAAIQVSVDGTPLELTTDYTIATEKVQKDGKDYTRVEVTLTDAGREKLVTRGSDNKITAVAKEVTAVFPVKVKAVGSTDGILKNTATSITNNGGGGGDVETPSNETKTQWGKIRIEKFESTGEKNDDGTDKRGEALPGAEFEAYMPGKGQDTCKSDNLGDKISAKDKDGNSTSKWITDAKGEAIIDGLHITDYQNDNWADNVNKFYCLVETKAPKGYELLAEPIKVELISTELDNSYGETGQAVHIQPVANLKDTTPNLPMTGGAGIGILAAIGAALVGLGAWFARRNSKEA